MFKVFIAAKLSKQIFIVWFNSYEVWLSKNEVYSDYLLCFDWNNFWYLKSFLNLFLKQTKNEQWG